MIAQFVYLFKSLQPLYAYLFSDSSACMIAHKHALHNHRFNSYYSTGIIFISLLTNPPTGVIMPIKQVAL